MTIIVSIMSVKEIKFEPWYLALLYQFGTLYIKKQTLYEELMKSCMKSQLIEG